MSEKKLQLQERDIGVLKDLIDFNGLPTQAIINIHFDNKKKYAYERLKQLKKSGFIEERYFYQSKENQGKRKAAILYATSKTTKMLRPTLNPTSVKPKKDELDIHYLLGNIYVSIPQLLSARKAKKELLLRSFDPISAAIACDPTVYLYILKNDATVDKVNRIYSFAKQHRDSLNIVVCNVPPSGKLYNPPLKLISWNSVLEVLPVIIVNPDYYMEELKKILTKKYKKKVEFNRYSGAFLEAKIKEQDFYLGELISGDNLLRNVLYEPPKTTLVYIRNFKQLINFKMRRGHKFYAYSKEDEKLYKVTRIYGKTKLEVIDW